MGSLIKHIEVFWLGTIVTAVLTAGCGFRPMGGFAASPGLGNNYNGNYNNNASGGGGGASAILASAPQTQAGFQSALQSISNLAQSRATSINLPAPTTLSSVSASSASINGNTLLGRGALMPMVSGDTGPVLQTNAFTLQADPKVYWNIDFSGVCGTGNVADLYIPGTPPDPNLNNLYPLVVTIHGGAWANPGRYYMARGGALDFVTPALYRGLAVLNVDYGPSLTDPPTPDETNIATDVGGVLCQIAIIKVLGSYGYLPIAQRVALVGHSAGGHIAALISAIGPAAMLAEVNGAVVLAGVADLATFYEELNTMPYPDSDQQMQATLRQNFGGDPQQQPTNYEVYSAAAWELFYHGSGFGSIQWWHGYNDTVVPYQQCQEMKQFAAADPRTTCNLLNDDHSFLTDPNSLGKIYDQAFGQGAFVAQVLGY